MSYIPLPDNAARQLIDSLSVYEEYKRVEALARPYQGGMYWKKQGAHTYLVKTLSYGVQKRLGPKSAETEEMYLAYGKRKDELEARLSSLGRQLNDSVRLNKALRVGRVPQTVVSILDAIQEADLYENFAVVGTHALYAYETAASVRVIQDAVATQDVDLLWDARRSITFITKMDRLDTSMLSIIQRADPSFVRQEDQAEVAVNDKGFKVEFLRREQAADDPNPVKLSNKEHDLFAIQAPRAGVLTEAPAFEQVVVSTTGRMSRMKTVDPAVFVTFKQWMGTTAANREPAKKRRDLIQATLVQSLIDDGLLITRIPSTPSADDNEEIEPDNTLRPGG